MGDSQTNFAELERGRATIRAVLFRPNFDRDQFEAGLTRVVAAIDGREAMLEAIIADTPNEEILTKRLELYEFAKAATEAAPSLVEVPDTQVKDLALRMLGSYLGDVPIYSKEVGDEDLRKTNSMLREKQRAIDEELSRLREEELRLSSLPRANEEGQEEADQLIDQIELKNKEFRTLLAKYEQLMEKYRWSSSGLGFSTFERLGMSNYPLKQKDEPIKTSYYY